MMDRQFYVQVWKENGFYNFLPYFSCVDTIMLESLDHFGLFNVGQQVIITT